MPHLYEWVNLSSYCKQGVIYAHAQQAARVPALWTTLEMPKEEEKTGKAEATHETKQDKRSGASLIRNPKGKRP